ncbi:MAG: class I SAM-dependent methyltransferase, partial [Solirubrobacterales bacterium]|nr:class I SAM-dependent methyltransferase [Solirubrobacterales bacterium]
PGPGAPPARGTPAAPGPPRLLDLGCWVGFLLAEARERGWEGVGVEPSAFASTYARERLGLDVRREGLLDADLPAGAFDAAILGDVIEHLPRPGAALDRVATLLRTGGPRLAWLSLPDAGSRVARAMGARWWSVIPTHVQYFTRGSLATLLHRHGWEVLEVATAPKAFTVRYYLERTGGYSPTAARALVRAARLAGVADRMWAPDFHDRMQVIARARG